MSNRLFNIKFFTTAFILGCCFLFSCENDEKQIEELTKDVTLVEEGKNIVSYLSQEGKMKARLTAPLMLRYQKDTIVVEFPNSLHVDFYDDSTKIETVLDSKKGKYFENSARSSALTLEIQDFNPPNLVN